MLCDINFDESSPNDSALINNFAKLERYVVSYHNSTNGKINYPVFKVNAGFSDFETFNVEKFVKFKLIQSDSLKSTLLVMYEQLYGEKLKQKGLFYYIGKKTILNSFIVDFRIWSYDLSEHSKYKYDYLQLGDFSYLPLNVVKELFKNRIIVLGDFEDNDIHETIYGKMPGPLILLNSFIALEKGDNVINFWVFLYLFVSFLVATIRCLNSRGRVNTWLNKQKISSPIINEMIEFGIYLIYFAVISSISFLIFNIHLTILLYASYMYFLDILIKYFKKSKKQILKDNIFYNQ